MTADTSFDGDTVALSPEQLAAYERRLLAPPTPGPSDAYLERCARVEENRAVAEEFWRARTSIKEPT